MFQENPEFSMCVRLAFKFNGLKLGSETCRFVFTSKNIKAIKGESLPIVLLCVLRVRLS